MKAVTLHQPWATLIARGVKTIETRSWPTSHRGPIAIHAAKRDPEVDLRLSPGTEVVYQEFLIIEDGRMLDLCNEETIDLPLGAVVATANVVDCLPMVDIHDRAHNGQHRIIVDADTTRVGVFGPDHLWRTNPAGGPPINISAQRPFGDYEPGRWAWILDDIQPVAEPIAAKGMQQIWNWEDPR